MEEPWTNTMVPLDVELDLVSFLFHMNNLTDSEPTFLTVQWACPVTSGAEADVFCAQASVVLSAPVVASAELAKNNLLDSEILLFVFIVGNLQIKKAPEAVTIIKTQKALFRFRAYPNPRKSHMHPACIAHNAYSKCRSFWTRRPVHPKVKLVTYSANGRRGP
jgi:hypothetical protein